MRDIPHPTQSRLGAQELETTTLEGSGGGSAFHVIHVLHARTEMVQRTREFGMRGALRQTDEEKTPVSSYLCGEIEIARMHVYLLWPTASFCALFRDCVGGGP